MLNTFSIHKEFRNAKDPETIAQQLRKDQDLCRKGHAPSPLAMLRPPEKSIRVGPSEATFVFPSSVP